MDENDQQPLHRLIKLIRYHQDRMLLLWSMTGLKLQLSSLNCALILSLFSSERQNTLKFFCLFVFLLIIFLLIKSTGCCWLRLQRIFISLMQEWFYASCDLISMILLTPNSAFTFTFCLHNRHLSSKPEWY